MADGTSWKVDDTVVLFFCVFGFGGGIATQKMGLPPIIVSLLFATGVASLIYRFLGGVGESSFAIGALKLTGTAAFLVGMTWFVNMELEKQMVKPALLSSFTAADLTSAAWRWDYGTGGWTGDFIFKLADDKKTVLFSGTENGKCSAPGKCIALYQFTNGKAEVVDGGLSLRAHVFDVTYKKDFDLQTTQPLKKTVAFEGSMQDPNNPGQNFGISLFQRTY